ncbi:MAG: VWA domain-containing protein, partial [Planctomycetota bacterium]
SMMRYGRFLHAKRVALGMAELIRARFPQDTIDFFGFASLVERLRERDLPVMMPKPVTIRDYEVRLRVPLDQAYENPERVPPHFTNLQLGLRRARQLLSRSGASNKQVFIITDGQPTAHVQSSPQTGDDMLYLLYPPDARTRDATLAEAMKCHQQGIRLTTFALIEDYWGMDWVGFVDQITRLTKGLAYYCASHDLSSTVIESYLGGRKSRKFVH